MNTRNNVVLIVVLLLLLLLLLTKKSKKDKGRDKKIRSGKQSDHNSATISCNVNLLACYANNSSNCDTAYANCRILAGDYERMNLIYSNATIQTKFTPFPDPLGDITPMIYTVTCGSSLMLPVVSSDFPNLTEEGMLPMIVSNTTSYDVTFTQDECNNDPSIVIHPNYNALLINTNGVWTQVGKQYVAGSTVNVVNNTQVIPIGSRIIEDSASHSQLSIPVQIQEGGYVLVIIKRPAIPKMYTFHNAGVVTGSIITNTQISIPEYIIVYIDSSGKPTKLRGLYNGLEQVLMCNHSESGCGF